MGCSGKVGYKPDLKWLGSPVYMMREITEGGDGLRGWCVQLDKPALTGS